MAIDQLAASLLARLGWASLQSLLLIAVVALLIRLLPRLSAAMRCTLWWLVVAQLLIGLIWHAPVRLPLLSPPAVERTVDGSLYLPAPAAAPIVATRSTPLRIDRRTTATPTLESTADWNVRWPLALGLLWLAGLLAQLPATLGHGRQARRLLRESLPANRDLQAQCAAQSRALGLRRAPVVRISAVIDSPQVLGWRRPTILFPAGEVLTRSEHCLALIHELAHVRRGDLWLGWIPALAQRLFFFHPLVTWAMREYALAREAACDAQVLAQPGIEPRRYGELLLRLGVAQPLRPGLASASPSFGNLKRRLTMLQPNRMLPRQRVQGWLLVALIAVAGVLPYRVTAAAADHAPAPAATASTKWLAPPPPAPPAPPAPVSPAVPALAAPPAPPAPAAPPAPPAPPAATMGSHMMVSTHDDTGYAFALLDGDSTTINGSRADLATVRTLRQRGEPMMWFRHGDKAWTIRDPATIERARAIYAPVSALATQQGKLGEQQGALGEQQGKVGELQGRIAAEQGQFAARQAELAGRMATLAARRAELATRTATVQSAKAIEAEARKLDAERAELDKRQPDVEGRQAVLGDRQSALNRQQEALNAQQQALGQRQQEASAQAEKQMTRLLEDAVAKGLALPSQRR